MGLALKKAGIADVERVGFARRAEVASEAVSIGAVDRATGNLLSVVEDAKLVIIATPPSPIVSAPDPSTFSSSTISPVISKALAGGSSRLPEATVTACKPDPCPDGPQPPG